MRHTCILSMAAPQKAALALLAAGEDGITWRHANVSARQRARPGLALNSSPAPLPMASY